MSLAPFSIVCLIEVSLGVLVGAFQSLMHFLGAAFVKTRWHPHLDMVNGYNWLKIKVNGNEQTTPASDIQTPL